MQEFRWPFRILAIQFKFFLSNDCERLLFRELLLSRDELCRSFELYRWFGVGGRTLRSNFEREWFASPLCCDVFEAERFLFSLRSYCELAWNLSYRERLRSFELFLFRYSFEYPPVPLNFTYLLFSLLMLLNIDISSTFSACLNSSTELNLLSAMYGRYFCSTFFFKIFNFSSTDNGTGNREQSSSKIVKNGQSLHYVLVFVAELCPTNFANNPPAQNH